MPLIIIPILLILMPVIEIAVFIYVGQAIGVWNVIALVILSAIVGAMLLRYQSLSVLKKINRDIRQGQTPEVGLVDGVLIVIGALLLIIPGFVTDVIGLLLMIPFIRSGIRHFVRSRIKVTSLHTGGPRGRGFRRGGREDGVVDLSPEDFERREPRDPPAGHIERKD
ncbi:FxsA family protein [Rhizobium sp. LjRoot254]|uniref:FxsA family protein n=1 Tax=Rhizobium sp. LjRoot254 TaxID=3342297 RepID=UPI003ECC5193